jgi:acetyl-CoA synthetase
MKIKYGSVGKPTPGHDVRIVDDEGKELPVGEEGNIALNIGKTRPPGLFKEYWKDKDIMERAFRGDYYFTGDRGFKDEDGYFWFVGRDDDVIKSSGYRIGPFEVESAFVVLVQGYKPSEALTRELQEHVKKVTAPYKYPRLIEYMEELPKTITGKILRRELRKS